MLTKKELERTYIKYSPEIDEKVFDRIIKGLNDAGCKFYGKSSTPLLLKNFKEWKFIKIYPDNDYQITSTGEYKEISYKDIIGEEEEWWKSLKNEDYVYPSFKTALGGFLDNIVKKGW